MATCPMSCGLMTLCDVGLLGFILLAEQFGLHLGEQEAVVFLSSMVSGPGEEP